MHVHSHNIIEYMLKQQLQSQKIKYTTHLAAHKPSVAL